MTNRTRYAVVPSRGCYSGGQTVAACEVVDDRAEALRRAARMTRQYREAMRPHGGSSGGYRVVETMSRAEWYGWELDREPSVG